MTEGRKKEEERGVRNGAKRAQAYFVCPERDGVRKSLIEDGEKVLK